MTTLILKTLKPWLPRCSLKTSNPWMWLLWAKCKLSPTYIHIYNLPHSFDGLTHETYRLSKYSIRPGQVEAASTTIEILTSWNFNPTRRSCHTVVGHCYRCGQLIFKRRHHRLQWTFDTRPERPAKKGSGTRYLAHWRFIGREKKFFTFIKSRRKRVLAHTSFGIFFKKKSNRFFPTW